MPFGAENKCGMHRSFTRLGQTLGDSTEFRNFLADLEAVQIVINGFTDGNRKINGPTGQFAEIKMFFVHSGQTSVDHSQTDRHDCHLDLRGNEGLHTGTETHQITAAGNSSFGEEADV